MKELFPISSVTIKRQSPDIFDLTADIGPTTPKRKQKPVHLKTSKVTVFLLQDKTRSVLRGTHRTSLQESKRVVSLDIFRNMSSSEVKSAIINAFNHLKLASFCYMKCVGSSLISDDVQVKDGNLVIDASKLKKGVIYINDSVEVSWHIYYITSIYNT